MILDIIFIISICVVFWYIRKLKKEICKYQQKIHEHNEVLSLHNSMFMDVNTILKNISIKNQLCTQDRMYLTDSILKLHDVVKSNLESIDSISEHTVVTTGFCPMCAQYLIANEHLETCIYSNNENKSE